MNTLIKVVSAFAIIFFSSAVSVLSAADIEGSSDHPSLKRYEGADIIKYEYREYDEFKLPLGKAKSSQELVEERKIEGAVTRITYKIPVGRSPIETIRNYRTELDAQQYTTVFSASKGDLGGYFAEAAGYKEIKWPPNVPGLTLNSDEQVFLAAEKKGPESTIVVVLYAVKNKFWANNLKNIEKGQTLLQVDIIESRTMEVKMVTVAAEEMAEKISTSGSIALYGILFDTNKADVKAESEETLLQISKLMKDNKRLTLLVVGHTDSAGDYSYNLNLSQKRAEAVVRALVKNYGINTARLKPVGVSYACPVASNNSAKNRAKNRRVELVEDSPKE